MPALDAEIPSSTSARARTSTSRAAYGAPEAPVIPRKTRTARLFRALGGGQELAELAQLLIAQRTELRHHVVAELRGVLDVVRETLGAAAGRADGREVRRAEVRRAGAQVGVTRSAAGARERRRAGNGCVVVLEPLALRPGRHRLDDLAGKRLLRGRALVRQHAHREDDQHG